MTTILREPTEYTTEQYVRLDGFQDKALAKPEDLTVFASPRGLLSPVDWDDSLAFMQAQATHPSQSWAGLCQMLCRTSYRIPALFGSAYAQWLGADDEDKHVGGDPHDAPVGAGLCFKGSSSPYGHIMIAARPFKNGTEAAWSNDMVARGMVDKVARTSPVTHWGQRYLGYVTAINDYDLRLKSNEPPAPKQTRRYRAIARAIDALGVALDTAKAQNDTADIKALRAEIARLKGMYDKMRRA